MIRKLILLIFFLGNCSVYAQQSRIDSLKNDLIKNPNDTGTVWTYVRLGLTYQKKNLDSALVCFRQGIKLSEKLKFYPGWHATHVRVGNVYLVKGDYDSAEQHYIKALEIIDKYMDNDPMASRILNNLGLVYRYKGMFDRSLDYLLRALAIKEKMNDSLGLGSAYHNIGIVFAMQKEYVKAENYVEKARRIFEELGDSAYLYQVTLDYSSLLKEMNDIEGSIYWSERAYRFFRMSGDIRGAAKARYNLGVAYTEQGNYRDALVYFKDSREVFEKLGDKYNTATCDMDIAKAMYEQERYSEALEYAQQGLDIAKPIGSKDLMSGLYQRLSLIYSAQHNYEKAYENHVLYSEMQDSLLNEEKQKALLNLEAKYNDEVQRRELSELRREQVQADLDNRKREVRSYVLYGIIVLAVIALILIGVQYQIKQRRNVILSEKNAIIQKSLQEKEVLLREIHHRVQNNLQFVSSLLNLQSRYVTDQQTLNVLKESRSRIQSMAMIHQKLYQEDNLQGINFENYVRNLVDTISNSYSVNKENISIIFEIDPVELEINTAISIGLILNELITNVFKYAFEGREKGRLLIRLRRRDDKLYLTVQDDGVGLPERFDLEDSDSFGMKLVSSLAKKLKATMEVTGGIGTTVHLEISEFENV